MSVMGGQNNSPWRSPEAYSDTSTRSEGAAASVATELPNPPTGIATVDPVSGGHLETVGYALQPTYPLQTTGLAFEEDIEKLAMECAEYGSYRLRAPTDIIDLE